jgi:hypothetical protein
MADAALILRGLRGIKPISAAFLSPQELVGPVALQALAVSFLLNTPLGAVDTGFELIHDVVMACQALVNPEEIRWGPIHVRRIGVKSPLSNAFMAVPAGGLTVGGYVKSFRIDEPRPLRPPGPEPQQHHCTQHKALLHDDTHPITDGIPISSLRLIPSFGRHGGMRLTPGH